MIENVILSSLLHNEEFNRRAIPHLKQDYFEEPHHREVFHLIQSHIQNYNTLPTQDELIVELSEKKGIRQDLFESSVELVSELSKRQKEPALDWLLENTEKFCRDRAVYNALVESIAIAEGESSNGMDKGAIPSILETALSVSFNNAIGHEWSDYQGRYTTLHSGDDYRIPFDVDILNRATNGGLKRKTLSVISAMTNAGKSLLMCHFAAANILRGLNVLYISLEMAEEEIAARIDANLLDMEADDVALLDESKYASKMARVMESVTGRLIIKEYPTGSAGVSHFRALLSELRLKRGFVPDIIYVDYVNICSSSRLKKGATGMYEYVKAICEELRGLAVEANVPVVSATQLNRGAVDSSDIDFDDISESFGLPATVDLLWALIRSEDLDAQNRVMIKQLKSRFSDVTKLRRFVVGIERSKFKLFNTEQDQQTYGDKVVVNGSPSADKPVISGGVASGRKRITGLKVE